MTCLCRMEATVTSTLLSLGVAMLPPFKKTKEILKNTRNPLMKGGILVTIVTFCLKTLATSSISFTLHLYSQSVNSTWEDFRNRW